MGKVLSTQSRVSHQDASKCMQREKSSCHRSTSKRHIARRARGMSEWIVRRYNKRASMANERLFASFHDYKRRNVGKRTGSHSKRYKRGGPWFEKPNINHIPYYATLNEECDLDESLVEFVKRSGLSMAFFLTTDQNQGCSHWDEETLYAEYAHIRQSRKKKKEEALAMAQQQLYMVPTHEKESYMSLEGVDIDIPMAEFYADTSDINEGSDNNQEDTLYNEVHPSVVDHYSTSAKEAMQELIKDSTSPSLATIGLEGLGEVKSECAAIIAPTTSTNSSSECPAEGALLSMSIAESEAQLMANIVDQDKDCTMRDADEGEALSHHLMDEQQTIDGLYSHLKFFSPKSLVNGSPTLAKNEDHVEYPMIEIVTEEKLESVVASIMINETVAQQHAENDLGPNNIRVLADTMNMLYNSFLSLDLRWRYYCIDINKDVRHKMLHSQIVLKKQETPSQVSLHEAKKIGLC